MDSRFPMKSSSSYISQFPVAMASPHMRCSQVIGNIQEETSDLLGPWASAPVPEDYTFGVELEFALHGKTTEQGLDFGFRSMVHESREPGWVRESVLTYLQLMGLPEKWR
jgi:hypothetical protein